MNIKVEKTHKLLKLLGFQEPFKHSCFNSWKLSEIDLEMKEKIVEQIEHAFYEYLEEYHYNYTLPGFFDYAVVLVQQLNGVREVHDKSFPTLKEMNEQKNFSFINQIYSFQIALCVEMLCDMEEALNFYIELNEAKIQSQIGIPESTHANSKITFDSSKAIAHSFHWVFQRIGLFKSNKKAMYNHIENCYSYTKKEVSVDISNSIIEMARLSNEDIAHFQSDKIKPALEFLDELRTKFEEAYKLVPDKPEPRVRI